MNTQAKKFECGLGYHSWKYMVKDFKSDDKYWQWYEIVCECKFCSAFCKTDHGLFNWRWGAEKVVRILNGKNPAGFFRKQWWNLLTNISNIFMVHK